MKEAGLGQMLTVFVTRASTNFAWNHNIVNEFITVYDTGEETGFRYVTEDDTGTVWRFIRRSDCIVMEAHNDE